MKTSGVGVLSKVLSITVLSGFLCTVLVFQNCGKSQFFNEDANKIVSLNEGDEVLSGVDPDSDGDGLTDAEEEKHGTDSDKEDTDGDGLTDGQEVNTYHTNPLDPDTDKGGINDGVEVNRGTNPLDKTDDKPTEDKDKDSDSDGLKDSEEAKIGTDKNNPDTDEDGLKDGEEVNTHKTNPLNPDTDGGSVKDGAEVARGTNPLDKKDDVPVVDKDTDGDGLTDSEEIKIKTDPSNPDSDGDGLKDGEEVNTYKTNPLDPDTDDGGVKDGIEVKNGKNPLDPKDDVVVDPKKDSDGDGLTDVKEKELGTDPNNPDTDNDKLKDGAEVIVHGTDPLKADTDGGGVGDGDEVSRGTNPLDPKDDKPIITDCVETKVLGLWLDPKNTKDTAKAEFLGEIKPFTGNYSSVENYSYSSASAHPKVGPAPQSNVFHAFLYKGKDGVNLTMYAGQDEKGDNRVEPVSYRVTVKGNKLADSVKLSDDAKELRLVEVDSDKKVYSIDSKYINNTDGGVVGPLVTDNFTAHYEFRNTEEWNEAYFVSGDKKYSLGKKGAITHFIVGYAKTVICKDDNISVVLKKKPEAVSTKTEGEFMFAVSPEKLQYTAKCTLDTNTPVSCDAMSSLVYKNLGVGKHTFNVIVNSKNGSAAIKYAWEIVKTQPSCIDYGPWSAWENVSMCVNGIRKQERKREICITMQANGADPVKACRTEVEYRSEKCTDVVVCPQYMPPICKDYEVLVVEKNEKGCNVPRCEPAAKAANRWCHMKDEKGQVILGYKDNGAIHKAGCYEVINGKSTFYNVGSVIKRGDHYVRCDSGPATEYPLKDTRCKPTNVVACPIYNKPLCKDYEELTTVKDANGCSMPKCVASEKAANRWCHMADEKGKTILGYKDNGAIHKAGCYHNVNGTSTFYNVGSVVKYDGHYIRCDSGPATEYPLKNSRCETTKVICPIYNQPLCKNGQKVEVTKDVNGCSVPRCVDIEASWVNSKVGETQTETCARAGMSVSKDMGYGICASGEDRPQAGTNATQISYTYGKWGNNLKGGTQIVGSYCYQVNQKRDSDRTDITVAYLCSGKLTPQPKQTGWINSKPGETQAQTCARVSAKPATHPQEGLCASGEDRPNAGDGHGQISYAHGKWGSNTNGGTLVQGSYCYQSGQKRDNDKTDITVAYYCQ